MIDKLIEGIKSTGNPTAVGLDTSFDYLPDNMKKRSEERRVGKECL